MGKLYPKQTNFTAGELSPRLLGRTDITKYFNGARELLNFICHPHGGISKRPGTHFVSQTKLGDARLISFEFNTEQAYILEFGDLYMRVYRNNGVVIHGAIILNGTFDADLASWVDHDGGTGASTWDAGGGDGRLQLIGGGGVGNHAHREQSFATAIGVTYSVSFDIIDNDVVVYAGTATDTDDLHAELIHVPGVGEIFTFTATTTTTFLGFKNDDATIAYVDNVLLGEGIYEIITPYPEADLDDLQIAQSADIMWITHVSHKPRKLTRTADDAWTIVNYAPTADPFTGAGDYPRAVTFYQQRLLFGGSTNDPSKIWSTKSGDYENMTVGTADADAFTYIISSGSGRVPVIHWLAGADDLLIGCAGMVSRATGGTSIAITPTSIDVREQSSKGCKERQPIVMDTNAIFIQRSARKIRDIGYLLERDGYLASDVLIINEHITRGGINHFAFQDEPDSIIWATRNDGHLLGMTYEKDQDVIAWHKHLAGGRDTFIKSVATIPVAGGEQLWNLTHLTVDGSEIHFICYTDDESWLDQLNANPTKAQILEAQKDCFYVDAGLTYDGAATTVVTGASHLALEEVSILADGKVHPRKTVAADGTVTLDYPASKIHIGLPYTARVRTLPVGDGGNLGAPFGRLMGWANAKIKSYLSMGGTVNEEDLEYVDEALFSGNHRVNQLGYDEDGEILIEQDIPLPFTLLAVGGNLELSE